MMSSTNPDNIRGGTSNPIVISDKDSSSSDASDASDASNASDTPINRALS